MPPPELPFPPLPKPPRLPTPPRLFEDFTGHSIEPPPPAPVVLRRHGARLLDPADAPLLKDQSLRSTAYVANRVMVARRADGSTNERALEFLKKAATSLGLLAEPMPRNGFDLVALSPSSTEPATPDAWRVLQVARGLAAQQQYPLDGVGLDHLLQASLRVAGDPFESSNGISGSNDAEQPYGRAPVAWVGADPATPAPPSGTRAPVVAVLDTGCGTHGWLAGVTRNVFKGTAQVGRPDNGEENRPDEIGPLDGHMDTFCGHGTFCAGLIRQTCPGAQILSVRVLDVDGATAESVLVDALTDLYDLAVRFQNGVPGGQALDVISLALGYYPEDIVAAGTSALATVLHQLGQIGVAVVAAAGNDATTREHMPALLTPYSAGPNPKPDPGVVPLISVGALNPDGSIALFSNTSGSGGWVADFAPGGAVVSTMPLVNAGANPGFARTDPSLTRGREGLDADDFGGGFARWSGTSFAAPILAGRIAQALGSIPSTVVSPAMARSEAVTRGWAAVKARVLRYGP